MSNRRIHHDAHVPVGNTTVLTTDNAVTLAVPAGASGIILQNLFTNGSYWRLTSAMSAADQGFKLDLTPIGIWFTEQTTNVYLWIHPSDSIVYQFVAPVPRT
jgi:hypothetical protein